MRQDTIKLLEENTGRTLYDINQSNIFFNPYPRIMKIKAKINKWDLLKLKSFCTAKETINKTERQSTGWEKIFANNVTRKGLVFKIYKQTTQSKMSKRPKQMFSKEDIQMAKRHVKRCSTSLIIKETQVKTTVIYYLTPVKKVQKQ